MCRVELERAVEFFLVMDFDQRVHRSSLRVSASKFDELHIVQCRDDQQNAVRTESARDSAI